jgi:hypothetical protein
MENAVLVLVQLIAKDGIRLQGRTSQSTVTKISDNAVKQELVFD